MQLLISEANVAVLTIFITRTRNITRKCDVDPTVKTAHAKLSQCN